MNSWTRLALIFIIFPCSGVYAQEEPMSTDDVAKAKMSHCCSFPDCCRGSRKRKSQLVPYQNAQHQTRFRWEEIDPPTGKAYAKPRIKTEAEYQRDWQSRRNYVRSLTPEFRKTWLLKDEIEYWDKVERGEKVGRWGTWLDVQLFRWEATERGKTL